MARAYEMQQKRDKRKQDNDMKDTATSNMSKEDLDRVLGRNMGMQDTASANMSQADLDRIFGRPAQPQMDPKLDAVMKMLNEMKMIG